MAGEHAATGACSNAHHDDVLAIIIALMSMLVVLVNMVVFVVVLAIPGVDVRPADLPRQEEQRVIVHKFLLKTFDITRVE